ncbi:MAG: NfeD family protein [Verrucomicrobiota bacterium]
MNAILLLFICGALLLTAEVFLPGAVAGIIGGCALLAGSVLSFVVYGATVGSLATLAALAMVGLMLYVELVWLPRTKLGRAMVVEAKIDGRSQPMLATDDIVGQAGTTLTTLAPSGVVEIAGKRYEAFCRSGHAIRGSAVKVVGIDNFRLIVSETKIP